MTYHPVMEPLSLIRDIIIAANSIVYQWNKEPNMEMLIHQYSTLQKIVYPLPRNTTSYDTMI